MLKRFLSSWLRSLALLCWVSVWGNAQAYDIYFYNCHNYANDSDTLVDECRGNVWGVFSCLGDRALADPLRYHTATWVHLRREGRMCLIEPERPGQRHCWKAIPLELATGLPDVRDNPEARLAARLVCGTWGGGNQWRDPRSIFASQANCSKPLPSGVEAAQPGPLSCAKQALGLPANHSCQKLSPADPRDPETLRRNNRCNACCEQQAQVWEKPGMGFELPGSGIRNAAFYWGACSRVCDAVFLVDDNGSRKATRVARRMNEVLSTMRAPSLRGASEADRRAQKEFLQQYVEPPKTAGSAAQSRSAR